jgi:hypothetical protein
MSPYKERTREFWFAVTNGKCVYEQYSDRKGWKECGCRASHIHHIVGEREQLSNGEDPEHSLAVPLCQNHHVRNIGEDLGDPNSSFHPDMGHAYTGYRDWKQHELHMMSIQDRMSVNYKTSPFADAARGHTQKIEQGERYINGDERTDEYYMEKMSALMMLYLADHPEEHKPNTKPHPQSDFHKKKHWWNIF